MRTISLPLLLCVIFLFSADISDDNNNRSYHAGEVVTVGLVEYSEPFRNPLKGFRGEFDDAHTGKYGTLSRTYIKWNDIENNEDDGVVKIIAYCNTLWSGIEHTNTKVIPRIYLHWPHRGLYWPADMTAGDYSSDRFRNRVVALIEKLGEAWDDDPRIAFIEMGIWGLWGEHHNEAFGGFGQPPRIPPDMQKLLGNAFQEFFKKKLVMVRYPDDFRDYSFGIHWDSFIHPEQENHITELLSPYMKNRWKTAVMGGEMAFDWGTKLGKDPTDAVVNHHEEIIHAIRLLHWNHLGWVSDYDRHNPVARDHAGEIQKALGYRFVIDAVRYNKIVGADRELYVSFDVQNMGSSPIYYNLPVEISLLDVESRIPVWSERIRDLDIRTWLPGDLWSKEELAYEIEPEIFTIEDSFNLPETISAGEYIVALSILDPAGNVPSVRFATANYFNGGRHPIGRIGIMTDVQSVTLDPSVFDDLTEDRSLYYVP
jgi:hypothetical protein